MMRSGHLRKGLIFLLVVVVVGVGLFGCARYYLTSRHATSQIAEKLQAVLGVPVRIDAADVGISGGSSLKHLEILEANGQSADKPWLTVDEVQTDLSALDVVGGDVSPKHVVLVGAAINLRFDEDGKLLTALPTIKPTGGQAFPQLGLQRSRLTLAQEGRPPMVVEGLNADASDADGVLQIHGTVHDDYWGDWKVEGSLKTAVGQIELHLTNERTTITQEKLERLPFVSEATWQQFKFNGVSPVDLVLHFTLGEQGDHYRVALVPENAEVTVTSVDLHADQVTGHVTIEDRVVTLRDVHGRTADGAIDLPKAHLDFSKTPYDARFDIRVKQVEVRKLPASWKISIPALVQGPLPLTGHADLHLQIDHGKAKTTGDGQGVVDAVVFNQPTTIEVRLKADENGFHFSTPPKTALKMLPLLRQPPIMLQPPLENAPPDEPKSPHPLAVPLGQGTQALSAGTSGLLKGGARVMEQVNRWLKPLPPGKKTEYLEAKLTLKNVDLEEIVRELKLKLPFALSGKVSFQVQLAIPVDTPNDTAAYKMHGSATSSGLNIAGLKMTDLSAKVNYDNGVLTLDDLHARFPDSGGSFDGGGKLQFVPAGDLTLKLRLDQVPVDRALALLPSAEGKGEGTLSGRLDARVPFNRLREPLAWEASGTLKSDRLSVYGLTLTKASVALTVKGGTATARDLDGELEGGRVSGNVEVRSTDGYPYKGTLNLKDTNLAALQRLSPNLRPGVAIKGHAGIVANFEGKLTPLSFTASGTAAAKDLSVAEVRFDTVAFKWEQATDRIKLSDLTAKLYDGSVSGSATIPLRDTVAGEGRLKIAAVDVQKLAKATPLVPVKLEGRISGTVNGTLNAAAPGKPRELTTNVDLTAPKMRVEGVATENLHGTVTFRAGGGNYRLTGEALGGHFDLEGKLPPPAAPPDKEPQGRLRIQGVRLSRLGDALHMREALEPLSGKVELELPFHYEGPEHTPVGVGRFTISDVRWGGNEMAESIQGDLRLTGNGVELRNLSGNLGEGMLRGTVVFPLKATARSWYHLELERVEASRLLLPFTGTMPSATSEPVGGNTVPLEGPLDVDLRGNLGSEWHGTGTIVLSRGKVYGIEIGEWRQPVTVTYTPSQGTGQLELADNNSQFAQGRALGRATLRWGSGLRVEGTFRFFEVSVPTLLRSAGGASKIAGGRMSGRLEFGGENIRSVDDLNATLDASFTQAQALQLPVLDVLARWVAPGQSAMTFDKGEVRATLARGVVRLKRLSMANATLQMLLEGTVTVQGRVNLEATASTGLVGINSNLAQLLGVRIPPVGPIPVATILTASSYLSNRVIHLRVTGTVKNPSVQIDPVRLLTDEAIRFFLGAAVGVPLP